MPTPAEHDGATYLQDMLELRRIVAGHLEHNSSRVPEASPLTFIH